MIYVIRIYIYIILFAVWVAERVIMLFDIDGKLLYYYLFPFVPLVIFLSEISTYI